MDPIVPGRAAAALHGGAGGCRGGAAGPSGARPAGTPLALAVRPPYQGGMGFT